MSLVHEIFVTEDLSAILTLAMLASLGLGAGVVWEEKHGPTPNENGFAAAVHSGALAALALVLTGPAVGQARGDFIDAALLPAGGTLYLLAVLIGGWASHRDSVGTLSDAVGRRGPKRTIALQGGIALGFGGSSSRVCLRRFRSNTRGWNHLFPGGAKDNSRISRQRDETHGSSGDPCFSVTRLCCRSGSRV